MTRQLVQRDGYLEEFARFWQEQPDTRKIWFSLYTPQVGEESDEKLTPENRRDVVAMLLALRERYSKIEMPKGLIEVYAEPPASPDECIFARVTHSVSADLQTRITPCQFGGKPDCANCGCIASAGLGRARAVQDRRAAARRAHLRFVDPRGFGRERVRERLTGGVRRRSARSRRGGRGRLIYWKA